MAESRITIKTGRNFNHKIETGFLCILYTVQIYMHTRLKGDYFCIHIFRIFFFLCQRWWLGFHWKPKKSWSMRFYFYAELEIFSQCFSREELTLVCITDLQDLPTIYSHYMQNIVSQRTLYAEHCLTIRQCCSETLSHTQRNAFQNVPHSAWFKSLANVCCAKSYFLSVWLRRQSHYCSSQVLSFIIFIIC